MFPHGELPKSAKQHQAKAANNSDDYSTSGEEEISNTKPVTTTVKTNQLPNITTSVNSKQLAVVSNNKNGRKDVRSQSCSRQKSAATRYDYDSKDSSSCDDLSDDDDGYEEDPASLEYLTDKVEVKYELETILKYLNNGYYIR